MRQRFVAACVGVVTVTALSGCGLFMKESTPGPPKKQTKEKEAVVTKVLKDVQPLTEIDGVPTSKQFFEQMLDTGYKPEDLEATIDRSPLDHDVPSKMFGIKVKEGCVIGEVRQGSVSGSLVEPNESNKSCLYGNVDRPEGVEAPKGEERADADKDNGVGHLPGDDMHERKDGESSEGSNDNASEDSGQDTSEEQETPKPKKKKKKKQSDSGSNDRSESGTDEGSDSGSANSIG